MRVRFASGEVLMLAGIGFGLLFGSHPLSGLGIELPEHLVLLRGRWWHFPFGCQTVEVLVPDQLRVGLGEFVHVVGLEVFVRASNFGQRRVGELDVDDLEGSFIQGSELPFLGGSRAEISQKDNVPNVEKP